MADLLSRADEDPRQEEKITLCHPTDPSRSRVLERNDISEIEPLLKPVRENGRLTKELPSIKDIREQRKADLERLDSEVKRLVNPQLYHVFLTQKLWDLKQELIGTYDVKLEK